MTVEACEKVLDGEYEGGREGGGGGAQEFLTIEVCEKVLDGVYGGTEGKRTVDGMSFFIIANEGRGGGGCKELADTISFRLIFDGRGGGGGGKGAVDSMPFMPIVGGSGGGGGTTPAVVLGEREKDDIPTEEGRDGGGGLVAADCALTGKEALLLTSEEPVVLIGKKASCFAGKIFFSLTWKEELEMEVFEETVSSITGVFRNTNEGIDSFLEDGIGGGGGGGGGGVGGSGID